MEKLYAEFEFATEPKELGHKLQKSAYGKYILEIAHSEANLPH